jgi:hypothetical protein
MLTRSARCFLRSSVLGLRLLFGEVARVEAVRGVNLTRLSHTSVDLVEEKDRIPLLKAAAVACNIGRPARWAAPIAPRAASELAARVEGLAGITLEYSLFHSGMIAGASRKGKSLFLAAILTAILTINSAECVIVLLSFWV